MGGILRRNFTIIHEVRLISYQNWAVRRQQTGKEE